MKTKPMKLIASGLAGLMLGLPGCLVGPDWEAPKTEMPGEFGDVRHTQAEDATAASQPSRANSSPADLKAWWDKLKDPALSQLVQEAIDANIDLKLAESRLRQSRAERGVVAADFWPSVNADGSYQRTKVSGGPSGGQDQFQAGFDAAWEIDVFGGVRRNIEASEAEIIAAVEDRRDVLVSVTAEVALNYIALRTYQRQLDIARENLKTQERSVNLTEVKRKAGLISALDVANAQSLVATTKAQIPSFEAQVRQTIHALGVLLGKDPQALSEQLLVAGPIPHVPADVAVGLPSDLLKRRPDIRRSEAQFHAATARIGVATADLFPKFTLTGSLGLQADRLASMGNLSSSFWSVGPAVTWNIFNAGKITSNIEANKALAEQAYLVYRQTVLVSLREVGDSLVAYANEQDRRTALAQAVAANEKAVDLSSKLYAIGETDFLNVLNAQRSLLSSQDALAQSDRLVAANLVSLYKALGGGWEGQEEQATTRASRERKGE
jgi:outer membrane protein, multidrug efflux system